MWGSGGLDTTGRAGDTGQGQDSKSNSWGSKTGNVGKSRPSTAPCPRESLRFNKAESGAAPEMEKLLGWIQAGEEQVEQGWEKHLGVVVGETGHDPAQNPSALG